MYSTEKNKYVLIDIHEFARQVKNEKIYTEQFLGLKRALRNIDSQNEL